MSWLQFWFPIIYDIICIEEATENEPMVNAYELLREDFINKNKENEHITKRS